MKKVIVFSLVLIITLMSCVTAFAAGINSYEQSVLSQMRTPANMAGNSVYVPDSYINQAEAHFNTIDMTADQASKINSYISQGRSFLESTGKSSIKELSASQLKTLASYASSAAAVLNLKAGIGPDPNQVKVMDKNGNVIIDESGAVIKTTGAALSPVPFVLAAALGLIVLASCAGVIYYYKKRVTVKA